LPEQILFVALGSTVLFGAALVRALRAERRKAHIELRLKAIVMSTPTSDSVVTSLRRPAPPRYALPAMILARLDAALAATGGVVGLPHLAATAILAAALVGVVIEAAQPRQVLSIAFAGLAGLGAPILLVRFAQSRYQRRFLDIFPDALDLIVRSVRAGLPMIEAIDLAAHEIRKPVGTEFDRVLGEIRIGVELEDALQRAADHIRVPDFRFFVVSLALHRRAGGSIAEILSNLSTVIRQRRALRMKARALTAEATASAAVVAAMPFIAALGLFLINPQLVSVLFVDPRGRLMLGVAAIGLLSGMALMKAMIRKSLR